jgi:hypothetical protein
MSMGILNGSFPLRTAEARTLISVFLQAFFLSLNPGNWQCFLYPLPSISWSLGHLAGVNFQAGIQRLLYSTSNYTSRVSAGFTLLFTCVPCLASISPI